MNFEKTVIMPAPGFTGQDRRVVPRHRVSLKARVISPGPREMSLDSLSTSGFSCLAATPYLPGTTLLMEIEFGDGDGKVPMILGGQVVHVDPFSGRMGVAFPKLQGQLRSFLREQSAQ